MFSRVVNPRKGRHVGVRVAVECTCDRCGTTWYEDHAPGDPMKPVTSLSITFSKAGEEPERTGFEVLCESCTQTCQNYVNHIVKDLKKKPGAKKKEGADAPSSPTVSSLPSGGTPSRSGGARST